MDDRICLITGATAGLGKATALGLAKLGAMVVVMARDSAKGEMTVAELKQVSGNQEVALLLCDLSSQASIRVAAAEFKQRYARLDVLINNAALTTQKRIQAVSHQSLSWLALSGAQG